MGKRAYAIALYGDNVTICDLAISAPEEMFETDIVVNLQAGVRYLLEKREFVQAFFEAAVPRMAGKVLIGDEIGGGVVPMDPFERLWRDETGLVYQLIAARADIVDRVWAGLPERLKG